MQSKRVRIFAGPNGSGKSSLFQEFCKIHSTGPFVNTILSFPPQTVHFIYFWQDLRCVSGFQACAHSKQWNFPRESTPHFRKMLFSAQACICSVIGLRVLLRSAICFSIMVLGIIGQIVLRWSA